MFSKLLKRMRSDRADSTLVTFVMVMPLFFGFIVTMIDTSIYFSNRSTVQQVARDAARQVAIFGGAGNATTRTPLEAAYGNSGACSALGAGNSRAANKNEIECQLLQRYDAGSGLTNVTIQRVSCTPVSTTYIGQPTTCDVDWNYGGVPGSAISFIRNSSGEPPFKVNKTRVSSQAEVNMSGITLVGR